MKLFHYSLSPLACAQVLTPLLFELDLVELSHQLAKAFWIIHIEVDTSKTHIGNEIQSTQFIKH